MTLDLIAFFAAFAVALVLYPPFIRLLQRARAGQVIQEELPESHQRKAGTPTAGGAVFVLVGIAAGVIAVAAGYGQGLPAIAGLVVGGALGFADDSSKLRIGTRGIPARLKFPIQIVLALPVAWLAASGAPPQLYLVGAPSWVIFLLAVFAIVSTANAVNITDGMDGLAAGLSFIAIGTMSLFLYAQGGDKAVGMALCGALAAFLVFNRYPARVFMGDTGSLAIGYGLAAMAIQQGVIVALPIVGLVFVLETLSVIIQVAYFKTSGGRRVFPMTPIHYTFHHEGWSENRIALTFWGAGLVSAIAAIALVRLHV